MTLEQGKQLIEKLKKEELSDEEIAIVLHDKFRIGEISIDELNELVGLVGYELTKEFYQMSEEEQKEPLYDSVDDFEEDDYDDHLQKEPIKHEIRINDEKYLDKKIVELFGSFIKITD